MSDLNTNLFLLFTLHLERNPYSPFYWKGYLKSQFQSQGYPPTDIRILISLSLLLFFPPLVTHESKLFLFLFALSGSKIQLHVWTVHSETSQSTIKSKCQESPVKQAEWAKFIEKTSSTWFLQDQSEDHINSPTNTTLYTIHFSFFLYK